MEIINALGGLSTLAPGTALVAIFVWLIQAVATGKIIPSQTHADIMSARDREVERLAAALERAQTQNTKLSQTSETTLHLLRSIAPDEEDGP